MQQHTLFPRILFFIDLSDSLTAPESFNDSLFSSSDIDDAAHYKNNDHANNK